MIQAIELCQLLYRSTFRAGTEQMLQDGIDQVLSEAGIAFEREVSLSRHDRVDFLVGRLAVEVKIDGSLSALTRQILRYAESDRVDAILVVTTRPNHQRAPRQVRDVPVVLYTVYGI